MGNYYDREVENAMVTFYSNLNERDKRHFASLSTMQLPYGGKKYISTIFGIDERTIYQGKVEFKENDIPLNRIRKEGAGRKPIYDKHPNLDSVFLKVLKEHTAGDPMNIKIIWTDLTKNEIINLMEKEDIKISGKIVGDLLKKHGYVKRKIQKKRK